MSLLTKTDPISDCSASMFEGNLFSSVDESVNFVFSSNETIIE
jgi:hypothetical protein